MVDAFFSRPAEHQQRGRVSDVFHGRGQAHHDRRFCLDGDAPQRAVFRRSAPVHVRHRRFCHRGQEPTAKQRRHRRVSRRRTDGLLHNELLLPVPQGPAFDQRHQHRDEVADHRGREAEHHPGKRAGGEVGVARVQGFENAVGEQRLRPLAGGKKLLDGGKQGFALRLREALDHRVLQRREHVPRHRKKVARAARRRG